MKKLGKIIENAIITIGIAMFIWFLISWAEIVINNDRHEVNDSSWNLIGIFVEAGGRYHE